MEKILQTYRSKLDEIVVDMKSRIKSSSKLDDALVEVRDELARWGKEHLSKLYLELKDYVEKNNPEFIEKNKEKWEVMLDKAQALTEYGLYVAPIDLLRDEDTLAKSVYVGVGALLGGLILSKIITGKMRLLPSVVLSVGGGAASYYLMGSNKEDEIKNTVLAYIDDAKEWIDTAFENMYKIFKDAV